MIHDWFIGVCNTNNDGVKITRFRGTEAEVKAALLDMVQTDKENESDIWDMGTDSVDEITVMDDKSYYAFNSFTDHHIDYSAYRLCDIDFY